MHGSRGWRNLSNYPDHPKHLDDSQRSTNQPLCDPNVPQYYWPSQDISWKNQNCTDFSHNPPDQMWPRNRVCTPIPKEHNSVPYGRGTNNYQQREFQPRLRNSHNSSVNQSNFNQKDNHMNQSSFELKSSINWHQRHLPPDRDRGLPNSHYLPSAQNRVNEPSKPGPSSTSKMSGDSETPLTSSTISLINEVKNSLKLMKAKQNQNSSDKGKVLKKMPAKFTAPSIPPSRSRSRSSDSSTETNTFLNGIGFIDKNVNPTATNAVIKFIRLV